MIIVGPYSIEEFHNQNKIIITVPQTTRTLTNSYSKVVERKDKLSDDELLSILTVVEKFYEKEN